MNLPGNFQDIIARAGVDLEHLFDVKPEVKRRIEITNAKNAEDARMIAAAWADFAATPQGEKALQALFDATLNRVVFSVNLGQDAQTMTMWGCFREGQNALAYEIARQISVGRNPEDQPKPRDVT